MKRSLIATALALSMGVSASHAVDMNSATFTMFSTGGGLVGVPDTGVTGSIGSGAFAVVSTTTFFGFNWTAHDGTTFGPGTYTIDTIEGGVYTGLTVGAGQVGGHILFDWNTSANIDVALVWDITNNGNGTVTYTSTDSAGFANPGLPPPVPDGYDMLDTIRGYKMIDGAFPAFNANFDFTIAAPPTANNDSIGTTVDTLVTINLVANDSAAATTAAPADTAAVTPAAVPPATLTLPVSPLISGALLSDNGDGSVDYTPPAGTALVDTFQYTLTDDAGRQSALATVQVTVSATANTPPAANDVDFNTNEDTAITIAITDTDDNGIPVATDADGDSLTYATFTQGSNGAVTVDGSSTVLTYTPTTDFNGVDTIDFTVNDGIADSAQGTITITVNPVNDPFVCTDVNQTTATNSVLLIDVATDLLSTCSDPDGDTITLDSTTQPTEPGSTLAFDGLNTLTYTPATDFEGQDTFTYTATDGAFMDTRTVFVDVSGTIYGNFTMVDAGGSTFGGTNDIIADWDGSLNTDVASTNFNMTMGSESSHPFFGFPWSAHNIRVFGPGTYSFDTTCSTQQLEAGIANCGGTNSDMLALTIPAGQNGAHMLFDWNTTKDIDVVLLWEQDGSWTTPFPAQLYQGDAGPTPALDAIFEYLSVDVDGDGLPGAKMIDGPFIDFQANFNLNFTRSSDGGEFISPAVSINSPNLGSSTSGCTIGRTPTALHNHIDWLILSGFIAWLSIGVRRGQQRKLD